MANKMADKKKQASQSSRSRQSSQVSTRNRAAELARKQGSAKEQPAKRAKVVTSDDAKAVAREERKEQPEKSAKAVTSDGAKEQPAKSAKAITSNGAKAAAREERRERPKGESKPVRRESKGPSTLVMRIRNNRIGRFVLGAYYELRHKVTWPTFEEARNMTFAVLALSAAVGAVLGLADYGLQQLFLLIGK